MTLKPILELSALILSLVNGLMLLKNYLRDRPRLSVSAIHPDAYQWFFKLPDGKYEDQPTRKYGFLAYISITNRGLRDVSLDSWHLHVKNVGEKWVELKPLSIPEPRFEVGESGSVKVWPVLGTKGQFHDGDTMIKAGSSVSGFAYYVAEFYGRGAWNPFLQDGKAVGTIRIQSVFGNHSESRIFFKEIPLERAKRLVEGIDKVDSSSTAEA